jgi:antitoxin HicB
MSLAARLYRFPASFEPQEEDGGFVVRFRDLPEIVTQGDSLEEARLSAADALEEAVAGRIVDRAAIPIASDPRQGECLIELTASMAIKAAFYEATISMRRAELVAKLGIDEKELRRLIDPRHASKLNRVEKLLALLGKRLSVSVEDSNAAALSA